MSMISTQCDELRQTAECVGLAMPQAATLMMEAADTIERLRESVHRERAEADRLRTQLADVTESMGRVEKRCAKLHEQVDYVTPIAWYAASERERNRMRELGVEVG